MTISRAVPVFVITDVLLDIVWARKIARRIRQNRHEGEVPAMRSVSGMLATANVSTIGNLVVLGIVIGRQGERRSGLLAGAAVAVIGRVVGPRVQKACGLVSPEMRRGEGPGISGLAFAAAVGAAAGGLGAWIGSRFRPRDARS